MSRLLRKFSCLGISRNSTSWNILIYLILVFIVGCFVLRSLDEVYSQQGSVTEGVVSEECQMVLYGTNEEIEKQRKQNEMYLDVGDKPLPWKDDVSDKQVAKLVGGNCQHFKQKYKFISNNEDFSTKEELKTSIAYSILVHENSHQLSTLLAAIYREQNVYCIHVDKKSSKEFKSAINIISSCFQNVFLSTKTQDVVYASIERLLADVNCINNLLHIPPSMYSWKHLINLCGQDFPLLTNREIVAQLQELKGRNFIHGDLHPPERILQRTAFKYKIELSADNSTRTLKKTKTVHEPPPFNLTINKNLAYNIFSRKFLQWAFIDGDVGYTLLKWSRDTYTPDEHFWMMLNNHPDAPDSSRPYGYDIARRIRWKKVQQTCRGYYRHGICVFGAGDVKDLIEPESVPLFANKLDMSTDSVAVHCMHQWIRERSLLPQEKRIKNSDKIPRKI